MKCTTYYFRPLGLLLLLCLIPLCSIAQNITVKGIVKDNLGESVIGANVTEKGTTNGMITDLDGNFSLTVQKNATLVISYIGYARAGRIIDQMEERGIISGYQGSKPREVLITKERLDELKMGTTPDENT